MATGKVEHVHDVAGLVEQRDLRFEQRQVVGGAEERAAQLERDRLVPAKEKMGTVAFVEEQFEEVGIVRRVPAPNPVPGQRDELALPQGYERALSVPWWATSCDAIR